YGVDRSRPIVRPGGRGVTSCIASSSLQRIANRGKQVLTGEGLAQERDAARIGNGPIERTIVARGDKDRRGLRACFAQSRQHVETGKPRHVYIQDDACRHLRWKRREQRVAR